MGNIIPAKKMAAESMIDSVNKLEKLFSEVDLLILELEYCYFLFRALEKIPPPGMEPEERVHDVIKIAAAAREKLEHDFPQLKTENWRSPEESD